MMASYLVRQQSTHGRINRSILYVGWMLLAVCVGSLGGCSPFLDSDRFAEQLDKITSEKNLQQKKQQGNWLGSQTPSSKHDETRAKKVRWDGGGVILGETDSPVFSIDSFVETINELLTANRYGTVKHLIKKYPDVALRVLQEANPNSQNHSAIQSIASVFDQVWCDPQSQENGWQAYLSELTSAEGKKLLELRNQFWQHLKSHQPQKALELKLVKTLPRRTGVMLTSEFYRLEAIALMMNDDSKRAVRSLNRTVELIEGVSSYQANQVQLLLGEFYRHSRQLDAWKQTWQRSVINQSELVATHDLHDPMYWSRAAFLRPAGIEWPAQAVHNMRSYLDSLGLSAKEVAQSQVDSESSVWFAIGVQHLNRSEGQNAILALKKAEAATGDRKLIELLQFYQARAMVLAGQPGAASAILIRIISNKREPLLAARAQAILGALKLQNGAIGQGINLLRESIEHVDQWPRDERLRAQADYGLALLVKGQEQEGLALLAQVQTEFQAIGDYDQAHQCLWNKAKYYEKTQQRDLQNQVYAELENFERAIY